MRKLLATVVMGAVLLATVPTILWAAEAPAISPSASGATFELTYRGLTAPDDPMSYRSYYGFGGPTKTDAPFIAAVQKRVKQYDLVMNSQLPEAMRWSAVELENGKPVSLYFDIDGNGELSDNERFPRVPPLGRTFGYDCAFITSDFTIRTEDQKEATFRIMLVGYKNSTGPMSYMWSPCCVLEGQATLNGQPTKMVLYASGFDGKFSTFRQASVALFSADQKIGSYLPRESLSSLICYKDTFYRLKLTGTYAKDQTLRVVLDKDTTPTGKTTLNLTGQESLKGRLTSAMIGGTADETIYFSIGEGRTTLPVGAYKLTSGYLSYGTQNDDEWRVNFDDGPAFAVAAAETSTFKLGEPSLSITAVAENDRYRSDVKPKTTFAKGTAIYISPQIKGKAGEAYMRFTRKGAKPSSGVLSRIARLMGRSSPANEYTDVKPHLTITGSDGTKIASADLEYG
jgi:hypothetical protein